ncbi:hypothetical protein [Psychrobium sp. 1_MG-2023]|nr:hypothetical protein [Psychrobium sp. 1_MG-2023]MDP2562236.1 hypothetical protein [Psychrobium sp. 1_MG-2023]
MQLIDAKEPASSQSITLFKPITLSYHNIAYVMFWLLGELT